VGWCETFFIIAGYMLLATWFRGYMKLHR